MKKKLLVMGSAFALGSALMMTSVYAGVGDSPGYDAYKAAIKDTASVQSMTKKVELSVTDNGTELVQVHTTVKANTENHDASGVVEVQGGSTEKTFTFYSQAGKKIVKSTDSDIYNVLEIGAGQENSWQKHHESVHGAFSNDAENIVDAMVGNLKDYVVLNPQSDGTKEIDVKLGSSQIPAVANAIGSMVVKHASIHHQQEQMPDVPFAEGLRPIKDSFPQLTQDVQIHEVDLKATVDAADHITNQKVNVTVTGKDDKGLAHTVVIQANVDLSDFNTTTPDTVDLTGKQIKTIEMKNKHI